MFDTVKNKIQKHGLLAMLQHIVAGTQSAAGFAFAPKAEAEKLAKAEPTFVTLDESVTNEQGQIKAVASQVAIDALQAASNGAGVTGEAKKTAAPPVEAQIVTLTTLPDVMRGGKKSDSYPFDKLNVFPQEGNAFFIAATDAKPNPAKNLASTVASATKRYKGERVFTVRKHVDASGKVLGAHVIRTK